MSQHDIPVDNSEPYGDDDDWQPDPEPGYASEREFRRAFNHYEDTIDHIMNRWSTEIEKVHGEAEVSRDQLYIHYRYDQYDDGQEWYLPIETFWDLENTIAQEKARRELKRQREAREKAEREAAQKSAYEKNHLAYIEQEARRLGLIQPKAAESQDERDVQMF